uniref:Uncharacterized protein n=1 Tax=Arundo donax TaxID=35708 RepID=A0A0A9FPI6_ARUDO
MSLIIICDSIVQFYSIKHNLLFI